MQVLESVGCFFDVETIMVYPMYADGRWYPNEGTDVGECSDEWWSRLSAEDLDTVSNATNKYYGGGLPDNAFSTYVENLNWN